MKLRFIKPGAVKEFIKEQDDRRVSKEFLQKLDAKIKIIIESNMQYPSNRKSMKDLI